LLGASIARWALGRPLSEVWKVALAGAAIGLALRLVSFGGHILVVRARAAIVLRALAVSWGGALLVAALHGFPGGARLGLRPVLERLLTGALQPAQISALWLLAALAVLLAATAALVAAARGFEERAQTLARQIAEAQESLRRSRSGQELTTITFRKRVPSLSGRSGFCGERALGFRTAVQLRRTMLPSLVALGLLLDIGVPLVLLDVAPAFAWAWTAVVPVGAVAGAGGQLAVWARGGCRERRESRSGKHVWWLKLASAHHGSDRLDRAVELVPGVVVVR